MKDLGSTNSVPSEAGGLNYNKLWAVACMSGSAALSIALIYWLVQSLS